VFSRLSEDAAHDVTIGELAATATSVLTHAP